MKHKRRLLPMLGIILCLASFRYFSGLNYAALHVVLPDDIAQQSGVELYAVSVAGQTGQRLDWIPDLARLRLLSNPESGIRELYAVALAGTGDRYLDCEVLFGDAWVGPVQKRRLVAVPEKHVGVVPGIPDPGVGYELIRLVPQRLSGSVFRGVSAVNWQGDVWLFLVPIVQAIFLRLLAGHVMVVLLSLPLRFSERGGARLPALLWPAVSLLRIFVLLLVGHQIAVVLLRLLSIRSGLQATGALCAVSLLLVLMLRLFQRLRTSSTRQVWVHGALILALFGFVRVLWSLQIDSYQSTDYGRYARYGELIAAGRWSDLLSIREPLSLVYARRAMVTTVPAALLFGPGTRGIEIVNLLTQIATAVVFLVFCCRIRGLKAGTAALAYFMLVPGFWYLGTIASHNVPTHLLLALLYLCCDVLRCRWQAIEAGHGNVVQFILLAAVAGALAGLLELSRTYGIFVSAVGLVAVVCLLLRLFMKLRQTDWEQVMSVLVRPVCVLTVSSLLASIVYLQLVRSVDGYIVARMGTSPNDDSMLESLAAIGSAGESDGRAVDIWRRVYSVAVPVQYRKELTIRKLLHEKLVMGWHVYGSILRRNRTYSLQVDSMLQTFDRLTGLVRRLKASRVPWFSFQQGLCDGVYLLLLLPAMLRLLPVSGQSLHVAELLPLFFTTLVGGAIFLLTECHPYYALVFALPLCWNAGLLSGADNAVVLSGADAECRTGGDWGRVWSAMPAFGGALLLLILLVGAHLAVGAVLDAGSWCFSSMIPKASESAVDSGLVVQRSRVHFAVARSPGVKGTAEVASATVEITRPESAARELRFLLTANQRILNNDPTLDPDRLIVDFGLSRTPYTIMINGRSWRSGVLADLKAPEFCVIALGDFPETERGKLLLEVQLGRNPVTDAEPEVRPEWLAIEYPHCQ